MRSLRWRRALKRCNLCNHVALVSGTDFDIPSNDSLTIYAPSTLYVLIYG